MVFDETRSGDRAAPLLSMEGLAKYVDGDRRRPLVVAFYAPWCKFCHELYSNSFVEAARRSPVSFAIVDADKHMQELRNGVIKVEVEGRALGHAIQSFPTIVLFDGKGHAEVHKGSRKVEDLVRVAKQLNI